MVSLKMVTPISKFILLTTCMTEICSKKIGKTRDGDHVHESKQLPCYFYQSFEMLVVSTR